MAVTDRMQAVTHANINVSASGANVIIGAVTGMNVVVINLELIAAGAVTVTMEDTDGTDRMGPWSFAANGGIALQDSQVGWSRTASGQGLNIRLSGAVQVGGSITYRYVPDHMEF